MGEVISTANGHEPKIIVQSACAEQCKSLGNVAGKAAVHAFQNPDSQIVVICEGKGFMGTCHGELFKEGSYVTSDGVTDFVRNPSDIDQWNSSGTVQQRIDRARDLGATDISIAEI